MIIAHTTATAHVGVWSISLEVSPLSPAIRFHTVKHPFSYSSNSVWRADTQIRLQRTWNEEEKQVGFLLTTVHYYPEMKILSRKILCINARKCCLQSIKKNELYYNNRILDIIFDISDVILLNCLKKKINFFIQLYLVIIISIKTCINIFLLGLLMWNIRL